MKSIYANYKQGPHIRQMTGQRGVTAFAPNVKGAFRMAAAVALLGATSGALAQSPSTPPAGGMLRDLEQNLPTQSVVSPDGVRIDVPDAPALDPAAEDERISVRSYRITGNTVFDDEALLALIEDRTGETSLLGLYRAADELTLYYRDRGYVLARAYLPQQEVEDGVITIAVLEGRYDEVEVQSEARVGDRRVRRTMTAPLCSQHEDTCEGALISRRQLERGLLLLNDTPGAQAAARLAPGQLTGTSTLGVDAAADPLAAGSLQLDNGGSYYSGEARGIGTLWLNSPAGFGDQLTLQGVASAVHGNLYYGSMGYGIPLGYSGVRFSVRGSYLHYELGDRYESLDAHGTVKGADASLSYPFIRSLSANLYGSVSYGGRRFRDRADAVGVDTERRISERVELSLNGDLRDELFGVPAFNSLSLIRTSGELELDPTLRMVDMLTARTAGRYGKWMASYSRHQALFGGSSLFLRISAQGTSDNLDSYEKFALGGPNSVRAYPASETLVDESVLYSVEWRQRFGNRVQGLLFYDRSHGDRNASPWTDAPNRVKLSGVGVGLNWALGDRIMLRSTVAWRGDRPMTAAPDSPYHYNLSVNMSF